MEMLPGVWKQHLRPRAVVGYGVKLFLPSPPNYVTRSPGLAQSSILGAKILKNVAMVTHNLMLGNFNRELKQTRRRRKRERHLKM